MPGRIEESGFLISRERWNVLERKVCLRDGDLSYFCCVPAQSAAITGCAGDDAELFNRIRHRTTDH
jgi:hypothetical protein